MAGFSGFRRLPLPFYSLLEELVEENTETNENIMRMDDLLIFMMLDEQKKTGKDKIWGRPWPTPWGRPWCRPWCGGGQYSKKEKNRKFQ